MAAPRPLPSRFDFNLKTLNRVDQHSGHANTRQVQPYLHNIRHRGLSLDRRCWLFTDSSEASPPYQGFHPTQPTFSRRAPNTAGPPRRPSDRTRTGRRRLQDDCRITGKHHHGNQPPDHRTRSDPRYPSWGAPRHRCIPLPARTRQTCSAPRRPISVRRRPRPLHQRQVTPQLRPNVAHHHRLGTQTRCGRPSRPKSGVSTTP